MTIDLLGAHASGPAAHADWRRAKDVLMARISRSVMARKRARAVAFVARRAPTRTRLSKERCDYGTIRRWLTCPFNTRSLDPN
jgi:hypothetical protein